MVGTFTHSASRPVRAILATIVAFGVWLTGAGVAGAAGEPRVVTAETRDTGAGNQSGNGKIDKVVVTFDLSMSAASLPKWSSGPGSKGIRVTGYQLCSACLGSGFQWGGSNNNQLTIFLLEGASHDTAATPTVVYEGPDGGLRSATFLAEPENFTVTALDRAGPVLTGFGGVDSGNESSKRIFNAVNEEAKITFSERAFLAGATPTDRWVNLERAFRFTFGTSGAVCTDSTDGTTNRNFPQPVSADPLVAPAQGSSASIWRVKQIAGTNASTLFTDVGLAPAGTPICKVGILSSATQLITDAAGNTVRHKDEPGTDAGNVGVLVADILVTSVRTADGRGTPADGVIDAVELTFDNAIVDSALASDLGNFTVATGQTAASVVTTVDTGTTPNDETVFLRFTGASWGTDATPTVGYTKPSVCNGATGSGSCLGSFTTVATDAAPPVFLSARTTDANANGKIDAATATFSEPVTIGLGTGWTVGGRTATPSAGPGNTVALSVTEEGAADTSGSLNVVYTKPSTGGARDAASNEVASFTSPAADGAGPVIVSASIFDVDENGAAERVVLEYSEPVSLPATSTFTVGGQPAGFLTTAGGTDPGVANDRFISIGTALAGTGPKAVVAPAGSIKDAALNDSPAQTFAASAVTDRAKPVGTITVDLEGPVSSGSVPVLVTYTEAMDTSTTPSGSFGPKPIAPKVAAGYVNGFRTADTKIWEGTATITQNDCTQNRGCTATLSVNGGKDPAGNTQVSAVQAQGEIDTLPPSDPTQGKLTAQGAPENKVNASTTNFTVTATIVAGEAEGGSIELLLDGNPMTPPAKLETVAPEATTLAIGTSYASAEAMRAAIPAGNHSITFRSCDDAANCKTSTTSVAFQADYTAGTVTAGDVEEGIRNGGDQVTLTWETGTMTDFSHVVLSYSANGGSTWQEIVSNLQSRSGSHVWTLPSIDAASVSVRASVHDTAGNVAHDESDTTFTLDSNAPEIAIHSPAQGSPFVGERTTITWTVTDATVDEVTIEYSTDGGSTWQPINGGTYSRADDGSEPWDVPAGRGFDTKVRVRATDAGDRTTTVASSRFARGITGYVADADGSVHAFGSASDDASVSRSKTGDWVRGIALRGEAGYVLSKTGRLYPVAVGGASKPAKPDTRKLAGTATDVVLRKATAGYVLDAYGRLHRFGRTPKAHVSKTWSKERARDVVLLSNRKGGYVLDANGRLHPFAVGRNADPARIQSEKLFGKARAIAVILRADERSGWVVHRSGKLVAFGGAPSVTSEGRAKGVRAAGAVSLTDAGGYWIDRSGGLHAWGEAYGDPTRTRFPSATARGVVIS